MEIQKQKYFSTFHFPWTQASTKDDKILTNLDVQKHFYPMQDAFASVKLDGECTTIGKTLDEEVYSHARSVDSKDHWSRHHIKRLASHLQKDIEPGWRICGENVLATHSIEYTNLDAYFYVFSVWNNENRRLSLDEMLEYCDYLGLHFAPILKRGPFRGMNFVNHMGLDLEKDEGYVVANAEGFHYSQAANNMAKFVRKGHVQTDEHWMNGPARQNTLRIS